MDEDIGINGGTTSKRSRDTMLLSTIREKLVAMEKYVEARKIIEEAGLTNADEILAHLGFTVKWKGLDADEARIGLHVA